MSRLVIHTSDGRKSVDYTEAPADAGSIEKTLLWFHHSNPDDVLRLTFREGDILIQRRYIVSMEETR